VEQICVFCGSNRGARPAYAAAAQQLGTAVARRGLGLVYGGGHIGLMGVVADAALAAGGTVIGVIPEALVAKELAHPGLTELRVVPSMHERKALMGELSDAFVALPGGYGTLEEFCEVLTWAQLGLHQKPCGLLDVEGYYAHLLHLFDHAVREEFVAEGHRALVVEAQDPDRLLDLLSSYTAPVLPKWIEAKET
jgi:uncharacterized protein (TIGR00730 family)